MAIDVFTMRSIADSEKYIENLGRKAVAEVLRDAEIAEAGSRRDAREQQELARQRILEAEKATRLKEQAILQEVAGAEARAEQAKPPADAQARHEVVLQETESERANLEAVAARRAHEEREIGQARAEATLSVGEAEAKAIAKEAEAYKEYEEAATLELLVLRRAAAVRGMRACVRLPESS